MKIITLLFLLLNSLAFSQDVYIPDVALKAKLVSSNLGIDINSDGEIQVSEALSVTDTLYVGGSATVNGTISDLTGIEAFTNITGFKAAFNHIEILDLSQNHELLYIDVSHNNLTSINVSGCPALNNINCYNNQLTNLDISNNLLLSVLYCGKNNLAGLTVNTNTALEILDCATNKLTELDVTQNHNLQSLYCFDNNLTSLNLLNSSQLELLSCGTNPQLTGLNFSNTPLLVQLNCVATAVQSINLSMCPYVQLLICNGCPLLEQINLKNGNNAYFNTAYFNLTNLPSLQIVCVDSQDSDFAQWVQNQVNPDVSVSDVCELATEVNNTHAITVYPNPTGNSIYITGTGLFEIYIYNSLGQLAGYYKNVAKLDFSKFSQGLYMLYIQDASGAVTITKVLKN